MEPEIRQLVSNGQASGFIELEHLAINLTLRDTVKPWYSNTKAHLFAEFQKQTPFRKSMPSVDYICMLEELDGELTFQEWDNASNSLIPSAGFAPFEDLLITESVSIWGEIALPDVIERLSEQHDLSLADTCLKFASVSLRALNDNELGMPWRHHPVLGIFRGKDI